MRLSSCENYCGAAPLCYIPCLPRHRDAAGLSDAVPAAAPCVVAGATEDKPPLVQKIEVAALAEGSGDEGSEDGEKKTAVAAATPPKSNLKKGNCADGERAAAKGNVKWLDFLGKDLTEVKEFEPSESGDSLDEGDGTPACVCVIQ